MFILLNINIIVDICFASCEINETHKHHYKSSLYKHTQTCYHVLEKQFTPCAHTYSGAEVNHYTVLFHSILQVTFTLVQEISLMLRSHGIMEMEDGNPDVILVGKNRTVK